MKKILVLGREGMAGHMVTAYLSSLDKYEVISTTTKKVKEKNMLFFNANEPKEILKIIKTEKPEAIINCIGLLIKASEEAPDQAILINSYLPNLLARYSKDYHFKFIHLSTDCVFSGYKGDYIEKDITDANSVYGRTKSLGEINDDHNLTIRTSIIGPEINELGTGLFQWFFKQKNEIMGYANVLWTGITTLQLAKSIDCILDNEIVGLIHLVPDNKISKYDLLKLIGLVFDRKINIKKDFDKKEDKSLKNTKKLGIYIPDYKTMLVELKEWMIKNKNLYDKNTYEFLKNNS
jgi:dTDP-4-dehydrorhamnose reductase